MLTKHQTVLSTKSVDQDALFNFLNRILVPFVQMLGNKLNALAAEMAGGQLEFGGSSLRTGAGTPSATLGVDGDLYWDSSSTGLGFTIYQRRGGNWIGVA